MTGWDVSPLPHHFLILHTFHRSLKKGMQRASSLVKLAVSPDSSPFHLNP